MVIITLCSVLVVNGVLGRSLSGVAARSPLPAAPESGSCLLRTGAEWVGVPCADPHTAEVVRSWSAADLATARRYDQCMASGRVYLGPSWGQSGDSPTESAWSVPSVMSSTVLVSGPGPATTRGWSWQACVVRPILLGPPGAGYRGRLHDVPTTGVLPVELRPCFNRPAAVGVVGVACTAPHMGEVLAARSLQVFGSPTDADDTATDPAVNSECHAIARRTTAAADPTYGGRLQVVVNLHATGMGFVVSKDSPGNTSHAYVLYKASCALQVAAGHELSASVVGLGAGPLPIT